jgi:hypothetical protein
VNASFFIRSDPTPCFAIIRKVLAPSRVVGVGLFGYSASLRAHLPLDIDAMGLILLVRGGEVVELEEGFARISTIGRSQLTCQKPRHADAIPIWTLMA